MDIKKFDFATEGTISTFLVDNYFIWIAFESATGIVKLYKNSIFNPVVNYFEMDITCDNITNMKIDGSYIYLSVESDDYIGVRLTRATPETGISYINKPVAITEESVDLTIDTNHLYFLTPGTASTENVKIAKINKSALTLDEVISLDESASYTVYNASSIEIDANGNLWIVTYENPVKLVKVEELSGGIYTYTYWEIAR